MYTQSVALLNILDKNTHTNRHIHNNINILKHTFTHTHTQTHTHTDKQYASHNTHTIC
jgi:hypothetical protein